MLESRKYQPYTHRSNRVPLPPAHGPEDKFFRRVFKSRFPVIAIIIICFLLAVATLTQYARMVAVNLDIFHKEKQIEKTQENIEELELEVASLSSLDRIEEVARDELGMQRLQNEQVVVITEKWKEETLSERED